MLSQVFMKHVVHISELLLFQYLNVVVGAILTAMGEILVVVGVIPMAMGAIHVVVGAIFMANGVILVVADLVADLVADVATFTGVAMFVVM